MSKRIPLHLNKELSNHTNRFIKMPALNIFSQRIKNIFTQHKTHFTGWGLVLALFCILMLPKLGQVGMFLDGVTYAGMANNLAAGVGSFWKPFYSETLFAEFNIHPPFALNLQASLYRLLGDNYLVDRLYGLIMMLLTAWGITLIWRNATNEPIRLMAWLPLFFWLLMPIVTWSFGNNMLENTVSAFVVWSVYTIQRVILQPTKFSMLSSIQSVALLILSVFMLLGGFLTKGLATLFPLAVVGAYWVAHLFVSTNQSSFKRAFIIRLGTIQLLQMIFLGILMGLLFVNEAARDNTLGSIHHHLTATGEVTAKHPLFILERLILETFPIVGIAVLLYLYIRYRLGKKQVAIGASQRQIAIFWLFIGLSGSLPILISSKQSGYYIGPAMPFFALSLAAFCAPLLQNLTDKLFTNNNLVQHFSSAVRVLSFIIIIFSMYQMVIRWDTFARNEPLITDIYKIKTYTATSQIAIQPVEHTNWLLHASFVRHAQMSLYHLPPQAKELPFLVVTQPLSDTIHYQKQSIGLKTLHLYKKK